MIQILPILLTSKASIAYKFRVSERKVVEWYKQGAPITFDGKRYTTELNSLQSWLVDKWKAEFVKI